MIQTILSYQSVLQQVLIYTLATAAVYVVLSAGVFSLAQAGFMLLGGYGAAIFSVQLGWPYALSLAAGTAITVMVGLLFALPAVRLKAYYLAIATLGFNTILQVLVMNGGSLTGGVFGITGIPRETTTLQLMVVVALVLFGLRRLQFTWIGRALSALRQDELAAAGCGIGPLSYHLFVFALSAAFAGLAGGFQAHLNNYVGPDVYGFDLVVLPLAMAVLGGVRHWTGPLLGSVALTALPEVLRFAGAYRNVITGLILVGMIIGQPAGLAGLIQQVVRRLRKVEGIDAGA